MKASAPASTANLGPGFDCLGAALNLELTIELGGEEPLPKRVRKAIRVAGGGHQEFGTITSQIPKTRGLGSSAACVAAGLLLGSAIAGNEPDRDDLLRLGTPIEGHPDNLAPALFGGLTLCLPDGSAQRFTPSDGVRPVILVPPFQLSTKAARAALAGHTLSVAQAAQNAAWTSGLVAVLIGSSRATREALLECTQDHIHQEPRREVLGESAVLLDRLRAEGVAAAVSGAGPSLVCLVPDGGPVPVGPEGWEVIDAGWNASGARLL